ncbi:MAG TPA: helix-turn-helix domain-containing protein [Thermomicrobiales bacterium]|jgi:excisionase family DNA binding protein
MEQDQMLTVADIVHRLRVHEETVRRWLRTGELAGIALGGRGGYRIREADLEDFLRRRGQESKVAA